MLRRGRLLTEKTTLDDNEPVTVSYAYDPLGELRSKRMGADLLVETYEYNLQGWRTNHTVSAIFISRYLSKPVLRFRCVCSGSPFSMNRSMSTFFFS